VFSRETQALMQAAVDAIVVIDHRGRMTAVNDATLRMFGYRVDELLGENVSGLMPEPDRSAHDGYMARYLETGVQKIIGIGREVVAERKDGTLFPVRLSVGRIDGAEPPRFIGILRDITTERDAFAALRLERDRANAYLELNDSILMMLDAERRVLEINARGGEILGAPSAELHGRDWLSFMNGAAEQERAKFLLAGALGTGGAREREFEALDANGQERRIHWRCIARRSADGAPAGWLCAGTDVTARVRREAEVLVAQDRLTRVARFATMGEMAAGIAHELNQPLTAISVYARAAERYLDMREPDLGELREAVREIGAEGLRAGQIIHRLRQLVRGESTECKPVDLNTLIEELRVIMVADARVHDIRVRIDTTAGLPLVVGDPVQIQQVILNLVRNALEALAGMPRGAGQIDITTVLTIDGDVEIRVTDNGPGVAAEISGTLFEPFSTTKPTGTGLGLAISRTLVHAHKGTIGTRPVAPHGATFYVRLPVAGG
jgi:two-component system sensor kinase FixL